MKGSSFVPTINPDMPKLALREDLVRRFGGGRLQRVGQEITLLHGRRNSSRDLPVMFDQLPESPCIFFDSEVEAFFDERAHLPPKDRTLEEAIRQAYLKTLKFFRKHDPTRAPGHGYHWLESSFYWETYQQIRQERGLPPGFPEPLSELRASAQDNEMSGHSAPIAAPAPFIGPTGVTIGAMGQSREQVRQAAQLPHHLAQQERLSVATASYESVDGHTYEMALPGPSAEQKLTFLVRVVLNIEAEKAKGGDGKNVIVASGLVLKDARGQVVLSPASFSVPEEDAEGDPAALNAEFGV